MSDQKAILMINAKINKANMADVQTYLSEIMPIFGKNGGQPLARYKTVEDLAGSDSPEMVSIVSFPSTETIKSTIESSEFDALSELRNKAFTKLNLMICESL